VTTNLPAHLQGRQQRQLVDNALAGMSGALPPHISIGNNRFTLVDAAGGKRPVETLYLDCCIIDVADTLAKMFFEFDYEPGADDPPTCWSPNAIAPSRESVKMQARTCAECPQNVRGSETSKISGKPIKACRDEKWLAVVVPGVDLIFQFKITPGSFKAWKGYVERCKSQGVDMSLLVTRVAFDTEGGKTGVLTFAPHNWIDAPVADMRDKAWAGKATDALVGRDNSPAITGGTGTGATASVTLSGGAVTGIVVHQDKPNPYPVEDAITLRPPVASQPVPAADQGRRKRRTKAEMEASRGTGNGQAQPAGAPEGMFPQAAPAPAPAQQNAPFRPDPAPAQQPSFGIQQPSALPPDAAAAIDSFFGAPK
jgi:hypothetical protein